MKLKCKQDTLFIVAGKCYDYNGLVQSGYSVLCPYRDKSIFGRIAREICFRLKVQRPWYNENFLKYDYKYIVVRDPLVTKEYLKWLKDNNTGIKLVFIYGNMIGKARHIMPFEVPNGYKVYTYDDYDSNKYQISLIKRKSYYECFVCPKKEPEYDILFVGKDKGRLKYLLELEKEFQKLGLRTKFVIVADGKISKKNKHYQKPVPYQQIATWIAESKSILNVALKNQKGITVRDMEAIFNHVKLITTNKAIVDSDIYDPNNMYILDGLKLDGIIDFVNAPYQRNEINKKERYSLDKYIDEIIDNSN